jgi:hypothetical protein
MTCFLTAEAFEHAHAAGEAPFEGLVYEAEGLTVEARIVDHGIPCLANTVMPVRHGPGHLGARAGPGDPEPARRQLDAAPKSGVGLTS